MHYFFNDNEKIEPIQTVEELILAVSHAVEVVDSADEVERILADNFDMDLWEEKITHNLEFSTSLTFLF